MIGAFINRGRLGYCGLSFQNKLAALAELVGFEKNASSARQ